MDRCEAFWEWENPFKQCLCYEMAQLRWNSYEELEKQEHLTKQLVAQKLQVSPSNISLMCGGFDAIYHFMLSQPTNLFMIPKDSFFGYRVIAERLHKTVFERETEALLTSKAHKIICTPNNPAGTRLEDEQLLAHCNTDNPVFIDKTYFYFHHHPKDQPIPLQHNVVCNISLSKSLAMAGLRASILVGDAKLIEQIEQVKTPFHIPLFTSLAIRKIFDERWVEYFRTKALELSELRAKEAARLSDLAFQDPLANFLTIPAHPLPPKAITAYARKMGKVYRLTLKPRTHD